MQESSSGQVINLPAYDSTRIHFGFSIAINSDGFAVKPISNLSSHFDDTLKGISSQSYAGFNLGIIAEYKITNHVKLRFSPDLSFATRDFAYSFANKYDTFLVDKMIQSTFLDFPVDIKIETKRFTNFQFYALGGLKYTIDLAQGPQYTSSNLSSNNVALKEDDLAYEGGVGMGFYFKHFKFSIDEKFSMGMINLLIPYNSVYTESIQSIHSFVFLTSFNFRI